MAIPLEHGQTTLTSFVGLLRATRPGPRSKASSRDSLLPRTALPRLDNERRLVSGPNEQRIRRLFSEFHGLPEVQDDDEAPEDSDDSNLDELKTLKRFSYPREYKLAAIEYFQTT